MDLVAELGLGKFIFTQWMSNLVRYFIAAGTGWFVISFAFRNYLQTRRHAPTPAKKSDVKREIFHSVKSGIIFLIPTLLLVTVGKDLSLNRIYWDIEQYSLTWYFASYVVLFLWHDTWFYWTHRLMHHPKLYKKFHVIHWSVLPLFNVVSILLNVHGHLGHDIFSRSTLEKAPFKWFNHPSTHGQHHLKHQGNFSLYLVFWDKLMGTWIGHIEKKNPRLSEGSLNYK